MSDELEKQRLIAKANMLRSRNNQTFVQNAPLRLGGIRENLIGSGARDTPGEYLGDTIRSAFSGGARGIKGLLGLPETVFGLTKQLGQKVTGKEVTPLGETYLGGGFDKALGAITSLGGDGGENEINYRSPSTLGQYSGTIGEFVAPGGVITKLTKPITKIATVAGGGSEAAGQLTEGTSIEPFARITGALITPGITNKTLTALAKKSSTRPTIKALKNEKNHAYKLASQDSDGFYAQDINKLIATAKSEAGAKGYYKPTDDKTTKALNLLESLKKKPTYKKGTRQIIKQPDPVFIDDIEAVRKRMSKFYKASDGEVAILSISKAIDDMVATKAKTSELVNAARAANSKYSKAKLLEDSFRKADKQTAATGSGGNVVNKYRQTLVSISENPKKAQFFSKDELDAMDRIIKGNIGANTSRLIGKLSPSGNGLMAALNIGAAVHNPQLISVSVAGGTAKALSERQIIKAVEKLKDLVAAGGVKQPKFAELRAVAVEILSPQFIAPRAGGLPTLIDQEEPN